VLARVVRVLDHASIAVSEITLHRPSLDDVFLALTGHGAEDQGVAKPQRGRLGRKAAAEGDSPA
jgi:hypothetical protein